MIALRFLFAVSLLAAPTPADVQRWLVEVDTTRHAFEQSIIRVRAAQLVGGVEQNSAEFEIYTKGRDRALLIFRDAKNNGRKVLTVKDRMWLIVPGTTNPVPITPNQRLMGGASFGDVAKLRFADDFTASARGGTETVLDHECFVLDLSAKDARAPYPKVTLWVDSTDHLPRRALFFLPSGRQAREALFTKFGKAAGKTVVAEMEIRELLGRESRAVTRLTYLDYKPAKLDDAIFTPEGAKGL